MTLAKDSTLKAGVTVRPRPGQVGIITDQYHPGGQGNNIYQLLRVTRNGAPHLVGSVSKGNGSIVDFTTGEVLYDFSQFGATPRLGNDSYGAACAWTNPSDGITRYYFGGWIKTPANIPISGNQDHTNKYSYVVETADFVTWNIVISDIAQAADSWQAEVSDLIPTNDALYILRGDGQQGSAAGSLNTGVYRYTGGATAQTPPGYLGGGHVTQVATTAPTKGIIYRDLLVTNDWGVATIRRYAPSDGAAQSTGTYTSVPIAGGGTRTGTENVPGNWGILNGLLVKGFKSGYFIGETSAGTGSTLFVPLLISPSSTIDRIVGSRSPIKQVAGGVVMAANAHGGDGIDTGLSFLVWVGPGGTVKVIDVAASFGAIEVYDDRLYYGVSAGLHGGSVLNYKLDNPMLCSIPIEQIKTAPPPSFAENISLTSYVAGAGPISMITGYFGGYPTAGYTKGTLRVYASQAGNLTPITVNPQHSIRSNLGSATYTPIPVAANTLTVIDLTQYLDGDLLGFGYDTNCNLYGRISLQSAGGSFGFGSW